MVAPHDLNLTVVSQCPFCGGKTEILVNKQDFEDWQNGKFAQDAFPYLSANQREALISGICPPCWSRTFAGEG